MFSDISDMYDPVFSLPMDSHQGIVFEMIRQNKVDEVKNYLERMDRGEEEIYYDGDTVEEWQWDRPSQVEPEMTILHYVCQHGLSGMIPLIGSKCDWSVPDDRGVTPITLACEYLEVDDVKFAVEQCGADPLCINEESGFTTLIYACESGNIEVVRYLCELENMNEEYINLRPQKTTALWRACQGNYLEIVKTLVEHGADIHLAHATHGASPFWMACKENCLEVAKFLVDCGADYKLEAQGRSPLAIAIQYDNKKIVEYLLNELELNSDRHVDEYRWGNPFELDNCFGMMIGHVAAFFGRRDMLSLLDELCSLDLMDEQNRWGMTALHLACKGGHEEVAKYLITVKKCDPTAPNKKDNESAADCAADHELARDVLIWWNGGDLEEKKDGDDLFNIVVDGLTLIDGTPIFKWIPIMKRDATNWKQQDVYGRDLMTRLIEIEREFRDVDVSDGNMNDEMMTCVERYRQDILDIFSEIASLYEREIDECVHNPQYMAFLKQFQTVSREFGKFKKSSRTYLTQHRRAMGDVDKMYGIRTWYDTLNEIDELKTDDEVNGLVGMRKVRHWQPHRDDIVLLWGWCLVTQQKLNRFLIKFARFTDGTVYLEKGVKSLFRIREKMCVRYDWKKRGYLSQDDPSSVWDYVRGMVTYEEVFLVNDAMRMRLLNRDVSPEIYVIGIWNRFQQDPNAKGRWQDVMVHFVFTDIEEENRVICEVQLCIKDFTQARQKFGGHQAYSDYRNAGEIERCAKYIMNQQS